MFNVCQVSSRSIKAITGDPCILPLTVISSRRSRRKDEPKTSPLLLLVRMRKVKVAEDNETIC